MPDQLIVSPQQFAAARERIAGKVARTPTLRSSTAAAVVRTATGVTLGDGLVYLKAEHLQKTGSFKPRGTIAKITTLSAADRRRGIITFSAGNAGQGYAYAGLAAGVPVTIVMPETANATKVAACRSYGATVVLEGENTPDAFVALERIRAERDLLYCHPFDDPEVIAGHGSVGSEILEDIPDLDVVVVAVAGGGLLSGVAAVVKESRPEARIYGVEPVGSDALSQGLAAGYPVTITPHSVADGLGAPFASERTIAMTRRYVDEVVIVDDASILSALRFVLERTKQVVEPAGAAGIAALLTGKIPVRSGDRVCVVLCGGNVDMARLGELLAEAQPLTVA